MMLQKQMELLEEYKAEKKTFTNGKIEALSNKMVYVETSVRYELEEFSSYKQIKLNFRPEKDSTLKLLFLHTLGKRHVLMLVGLVESPEEEKPTTLVINGQKVVRQKEVTAAASRTDFLQSLRTKNLEKK